MAPTYSRPPTHWRHTLKEHQVIKICSNNSTCTVIIELDFSASKCTIEATQTTVGMKNLQMA